MEEKKATTNSEQKKKFKKPYKKKPAKKENQAKVEKEVKENKNTKQPKQNQKANKPKPETKKNDQKNNVSSKAKSKTESKKKFETKNKSILDFHFKPSKLKIIALGGLDEIGKNITVFEYENDMIIVDCGIEFPDDDMLGVDLVIPDFSYIVKNIDRCKGLFITHGHEDHIGSIPYLLKEVNIPIYGTKLTMKLIQHKLEEHHLMQNADLHVVEQGDIIDRGKMQVEFIRSSHSIPDSCMLAIHSPAGVVLHTGDFKVDYTPIDGQMMDLGRIAELGKEGVLAMLSDSTNAERKGFTLSEKSIGPIFDNLFEGCKKRIVVATFASNVHRVQQIVNSAVKYGRKIAVSGRSMQNMINAARELEYIKGETMSALTRMANGEHKKVTINSNDLVIISATPIPGNEKSVSKVINQLMKIGAEVVYSALQNVHVSGHACQEEQKLILSLAKPKYFFPVHGEYRQLMAHRDTAIEIGIPKENILLTNNGKIIELNDEGCEFAGAVQSGRVMVDGLGVGDVGNVVLRDRQHLSSDGLIVIVMSIDQAGLVVSGPDVISRGFVYVKESENLMEDVKSFIKEEMLIMEERHITDWSSIKSTLKDDVRDFIFQRTKRNPMILPILMEV